jgi:hypothetical protein
MHVILPGVAETFKNRVGAEHSVGQRCFAMLAGGMGEMLEHGPGRKGLEFSLKKSLCQIMRVLTKQDSVYLASSRFPGHNDALIAGHLGTERSRAGTESPEGAFRYRIDVWRCAIEKLRRTVFLHGGEAVQR